MARDVRYVGLWKMLNAPLVLIVPGKIDAVVRAHGLKSRSFVFGHVAPRDLRHEFACKSYGVQRACDHAGYMP